MNSLEKKKRKFLQELKKIFGAKKIPELMRGVGKGVKEFKDAVNGEGIVEEKGDKEKSEKEE